MVPAYWEDLNWAEFRERVPAEFKAAIIPIGTVEAHGVGPLGTDNFIPIDLVNQIADDLGALVCPPIHYGQVRGLAGYPGSIAVDEQTLGNYCTQVFKSIASWGIDALIVINGHGGNTSTLKNAAWTAHHATGVKMLVVDWWTLCYSVCEEVFGQTGGHAGTDENAYTTAIRPDTIHPEAYNSQMAFTFENGVTAYPIPGPVITYKKGQGEPVFDIEKSKRYREGSIAKVRDYCKMVLVKWEAMGL